MISRDSAACLVLLFLAQGLASAQFRDDFNGPAIQPGWTWRTGDGTARMNFRQGDGYGSIFVPLFAGMARRGGARGRFWLDWRWGSRHRWR